MTKQAHKLLLVSLFNRYRSFLLYGGIFVVLSVLGVIVFYQRPIQFGYAGDNCYKDITFLPRLYKVQANTVYSIHTEKTKGIRGYPLIATSTCVTAKQAPEQGSRRAVSMTILGIPMVDKRFKITATPFPQLSRGGVVGKISVREPLIFQLDKADLLFIYKLTGNNKTTDCTSIGTNISCDVRRLELAQNKEYALSLDRLFGGEKVDEVIEQTVGTVSQVLVTDSSVIQNEVVYSIPTEIQVSTDKPLVSAKAVINLIGKDNKIENIASDVTIMDTKVVVSLAEPLPRNASFELILQDAVAKDKGTLMQEYKLPFKSSGGPKIIAANIGRTSAEPGKNIVLTFDQPLAPNQNINGLVTFNSGASAVDFSTAINNRQLIITPKIALPICSKFSIGLSKDFTSTYGISGDSAWQIASRIRCHTVTTIGYSVQGRPIQAWRFGSGDSKVIYIGATHGNEKSSKYLMDKWIDDLEAQPDRLPASRSIIVIPVVNPDGFAANTRKNANGIDLNRNFPANDWKTDVTMPGGALAAGGGGSAPLSEPESQVLANFVLAQRPRLVLSYHAVASLVTDNAAGDSVSLASLYSTKSGYRYVPKNSTGAVFLYDLTGSFEDWLYDKVGIVALVIELSSNTQSEFSRNRDAMWSMSGVQ